MSKFKAFPLVVSMSFACAVMVHAGDFGDGWKAGYEAGWKQIKGRYSYVFPPFAPFPPLGCDSYRDGFAAGVLAGAEAAEEQ
jgi:hypothetical protein